jgi:heme exporter protein A
MLEARSLTVVRGRRMILTDVDLELAAGEVVHLAGANGSGKTSLLRVLAGLADPRRGSVRRTGGCAFVPEKVTLAGALQAGEWLVAMRRLRGGAPLDWTAATAASGLDPAVLKHSSATLSKGMLQRIALLEALYSGAQVLLLDEPFAGLDPSGRDWMAERLASGAAVLLTDHSGAAGERLSPVAEVRVGDGRAVRRAIAPRTGVRVVASHPDPRRVEQLRADGWHIESVDEA